MAVRNFWLEAEVDGRKSLITDGPRSKDGGMKINLYVRELGCSVEVLHVTCRANEETLTVSWEGAGKREQVEVQR